jgi:hypothetical protein
MEVIYLMVVAPLKDESCKRVILNTLKRPGYLTGKNFQICRIFVYIYWFLFKNDSYLRIITN